MVRRSRNPETFGSGPLLQRENQFSSWLRLAVPPLLLQDRVASAFVLIFHMHVFLNELCSLIRIQSGTRNVANFITERYIESQIGVTVEWLK